MGEDVRWLDAAEQAAWRNFISTTTLVFRELERRLLERHALSLDDYAILVLLSESSGRRKRMHELASEAIIARPQVTYRIRRLERAGVVERVPAGGDRRGVDAHLTDEGFALLERAAVDHVRAVRELVLDPLDREEFLALGESMGVLFRALDLEECREARRA